MVLLCETVCFLRVTSVHFGVFISVCTVYLLVFLVVMAFAAVIKCLQTSSIVSFVGWLWQLWF